MSEVNAAPSRFTDREGRSWNVDVTVPTVSKVRKLYGINLLELAVKGTELAEQLSDIETLVNVLYVLCEDEAQRRGMDDAAFGRSFTLDALDDAWEALVQAVINFSRRGVQPALQKVLDKTRNLRRIQTERAVAAANDPEFDKMLDGLIARSLEPLEQPPTGS